MIKCGDYAVVKLADGTVFEGEIVRMGVDNLVVDDKRTYGDWVFIEFYNIVDIQVADRSKQGANYE